MALCSFQHWETMYRVTLEGKKGVLAFQTAQARCFVALFPLDHVSEVLLLRNSAPAPAGSMITSAFWETELTTGSQFSF